MNKKSKTKLKPDCRKYTCALKCDGRDGLDLVITDPCYVFRGEEWYEAIGLFEGMGTVNGALAPQEFSFYGRNMVIADTIFGDWCCELRSPEAGRIGMFTADAGMVCMLRMPHDEAVKLFNNIPEMCWACLPKFDGTASISHYRGKCRVTGSGRIDGSDSTITFKSVQIG